MPCRSSLDVRARFPCFQTLMPDICFLPRLPKVSGLERVQQRDFDADTDTVRVGVTACSARRGGWGWGGEHLAPPPQQRHSKQHQILLAKYRQDGKEEGGEGVFLSSVC